MGYYKASELRIMKDGILNTQLNQSQYFLENSSSNYLSISHLIPPKGLCPVVLESCFTGMLEVS